MGIILKIATLKSKAESRIEGLSQKAKTHFFSDIKSVYLATRKSSAL